MKVVSEETGSKRCIYASEKFLVYAFYVHFVIFLIWSAQEEAHGEDLFKDCKIQGLFELEVDDKYSESQSVNNKKNEDACFNDDSSSHETFKTWSCAMQCEQVVLGCLFFKALRIIFEKLHVSYQVMWKNRYI